MSQVAVEKYKNSEAIPQTFLERLESITDSIRERAFNLFHNRGGAHGSDVEDWLQAERDVAWSPAAELVEDEKELRARIAVPGFDAKDIQVSATPDSLVIEAAATHSHEKKDGSVRFCEFSEKQLFRRLDLPAPIDVDKVKASLDKGILEVTAAKVAPKQLTAGA